MSRPRVAVEWLTDGLPSWLEPGESFALGCVYRSNVNGFSGSFGGEVGGVLVPCGRPSMPRTIGDPDPPYTLEQVAAECRAALREYGWTIVPGEGDVPEHECPL